MSLRNLRSWLFAQVVSSPLAAPVAERSVMNASTLAGGGWTN